jgi:hypothetical protein
MSHPVGEHLGLATTSAGGDQQRRRWFDIAADAVFDGAALFRVEAVQMPPAIRRLQLRVPFPFSIACDSIGGDIVAMPMARSGSNGRHLAPERTGRAGFTRHGERIEFAV